MQMLDPWRIGASHLTDPAPCRGPEGATPRRLRKRQRLKHFAFERDAGSSRGRKQLPCSEPTSD
jgi:hypothetical protein